jgi:ATP-dependent RNA helicase DDX5/DBP2
MLEKTGFEAPTPIQAQAWPICKQGRDIISVARTGSGKTMGFLVPVFERIRELQALVRGRPPYTRDCRPYAVVLAPTRELAMQIGVEASKHGKFLDVQTVVVYGGAPKGGQIGDLMRWKPPLVIGTPGRLNDLVNGSPGRVPALNLSNVSMLILDEADRMLDMGFEPQLNEIVEKMPQQLTGTARPLPSVGCQPNSRQTLMFSATWPKSVQKIASRFMVNPVQLNVGKSGVLVANESVTQHIEVMTESEKLPRLRVLLKNYGIDDKVIIFCTTKRGCERVANTLWDEGINCDALHGDKDQYTRTRIMGAFKAGRVPVLLATDVAARGLDVKDVKVVINYDFPHAKGNAGIEDYVHRIGRTGRAGAEGKAYGFFTAEIKIGNCG